MRLKSLEIKGFKSFADKTIVQFDNPITGIIGPNGCGKSNIIDSIRWVIGEQKTSTLRSENLESLLFNGSKHRIASNMAEVSLTFENTKNLLPTDFNIVTITRRFYKSGESEYRLNDVSCRLKDIQNLLIETGLGSDNYSIIELNMVNDILKDKDNARRKMLEQAAGVTVYKTRKKETERQLEIVEQSLLRIEDYHADVNNECKKLEIEAKKTEKYIELKKTYTSLSIALAKITQSSFQSSYNQLQEDEKKETDAIVEMEASIALQEAEVLQDKIQFIDKEKELQAYQREFNAFIQYYQKQENEKSLIQQSVSFLKEKQISKQQLHSDLENKVSELVKTIELTQKKYQEESQNFIALKDREIELKEVKEQSNIVFQTHKIQREEKRSQLQDIQQRGYEEEKKIAIANVNIENLQRNLLQLSNDAQQQEAAFTQATSQEQAKEIQIKNTKEALDSLLSIQASAKEKILQSQEILEQYRSQLSQENRLLDAKRNEYNLLKSMVDKMEGYPESLKFLSKQSSFIQAKIPILSDILYVKEKYRTALENVLESYLNYFVVPHIEDAFKAIDLLDQQKKGKAHFFILDQIVVTPAPSINQDNFIKALDVIEIDTAYIPLAQLLLQHVFIHEGVEPILNMSPTVTVVTQNGKYCQQTTIVSGGSIGLFEGKRIGRAKNIEKLLEDINIQEKTTKELQSSIQVKHQEIVGYNQQLNQKEIEEQEKKLQSLHQELNSLRNKLEQAQHLQTQQKKRYIDIEEQLRQRQQAMQQLKENYQQVQEQLQIQKQSFVEIEEQYIQYEKNNYQALQAYNQFQIELVKQQNKANTLLNELNIKQNQIEQFQQQLLQNDEQLSSINNELLSAHQKDEEIQKLLINILHEKESKEKVIQGLEQTYQQLRSVVQEKENKIKAIYKSKELSEKQLTILKDQFNELKLRFTSIKERLRAECKIDIESVTNITTSYDNLSLEDIQQQIEKTNKKIDNIGEVNPQAIIAFEEQKKRFDFIMGQKEDLLLAKDNLLQTIQEISTVADQQFLSTFTIVRENFKKVFHSLFTETDTADLILMSPDNIAETEIEIIAKPRGKKPSSVSQLSTGEKTLIATALLFAIYLVKPAPFCILDEVDAPLDDTNIDKFNNMMKEFSAHSQFIVVTHNKLTMSFVDVIYGVTMQEPGVSKLVPVDFAMLEPA